MNARLRCVLVVATIAAGQPFLASAQSTPSFKIAALNIKSGHGQPGLPGRVSTFVDSANCTDLAQPLNAWGVGVVQAMLNRDIGSDPSIIALALSESWSSVCGSPQHVQEVLGWAARTSSRNGTALVAKYGFAGPEQWLQLDTTLNDDPNDTTWVVRAPVCVDAACTGSIAVFAAHWYASAPPNPNYSTTYTRQAQQTIAFMKSFPLSAHVLVGDLNVWEDPASQVCGQLPMPYGLNQLRSAGYIDAWPAVHGTQEGYTGMTNRQRCGVPEGYVWKRIDYSWSSPDLTPRSAALASPAGAMRLRPQSELLRYRR